MPLLDFILLMQGSKLPALQQVRLNAPRVLHIHKVVSYIIAKLEEADPDILLGVRPVYWNKELLESEPLPEDGCALFLEVICNGMVRARPTPLNPFTQQSVPDQGIDAGVIDY